MFRPFFFVAVSAVSIPDTGSAENSYGVCGVDPFVAGAALYAALGGTTVEGWNCGMGEVNGTLVFKLKPGTPSGEGPSAGDCIRREKILNGDLDRCRTAGCLPALEFSVSCIAGVRPLFDVSHWFPGVGNPLVDGVSTRGENVFEGLLLLVVL